LVDAIHRPPSRHRRKRWAEDRKWLEEAKDVRGAIAREQAVPEEWRIVSREIDPANEDEYIEVYMGFYVNELIWYANFPYLVYTQIEYLDIARELDDWFRLHTTTSVVRFPSRYEAALGCYNMARVYAHRCRYFYRLLVCMAFHRVGLPADLCSLVLQYVL